MNLIYQYWDGDLRPGCHAGVANMGAYAERIGAEYLFEHNPRFVTNLGGYSPHYGAFKPIYDESFHKYDNVLFADTDVFAVDGLTESIFDGFDSDIGICTEPDQPVLRLKTAGRITSACDEVWASLVKSRWGATVPRTEDGLVKVYNSGVVLYSNAGLLNAADRFMPFDEYVSAINATGLPAFYTCDQPYLHLMLDRMDWVEMDGGWKRALCMCSLLVQTIWMQKRIIALSTSINVIGRYESLWNWFDADGDYIAGKGVVFAWL